MNEWNQREVSNLVAQYERAGRISRRDSDALRRLVARGDVQAAVDILLEVGEQGARANPGRECPPPDAKL